MDGKRKATAVLIGAGVAAAVGTFLGRRSLLELDGKVVFITGGSRGLGYLLAQEFGRQGARVAICARDPEELDRAIGELERRGVEAIALTCDVGQRQEIERAIAEAESRLGPIDILVNNAGVIQVGPVEAMTIDDFHEAMDVMYWGTVYPSLAVLPAMRERGSGSIVNITSIGAKASVPHLLPYSGAKFAALGFSEGLHAEVTKDGVHVTTVVPGLMRTGSFLEAYFKGSKENEYSWFAASSSMPLLAMHARRAARSIVIATQKRKREVILTIPAKLLALFHGIAPGTTMAAMSVANRLLPEHEGEATGRIKGKTAHVKKNSRLLHSLTWLGRRAARRYQR